MAQLIVRSIDEALVHELKLRAARHRRSAEAEHREILQAALGQAPGPHGIKALCLAMPDVGDDSEFARIDDRGRDAAL